MVVKSQIKYIKSLHQKKYRKQHGMFVVEGSKIILELLKADKTPVHLYSSEPTFANNFSPSLEVVSKAELKKMSGLKSPSTVLGVFRIPQPEVVNYAQWVVALDGIQDPGNLGTIIRLCDWFGIFHLVCSFDTVDCYNPKVLQATMGSISRVNIVYANISKILKNKEESVYGAFMEGNSIYENPISKTGILVLGNEGHGISTEISDLITTRVTIPQFGGHTAESLNVATATAIFLSEIRRVRA